MADDDKKFNRPCPMLIAVMTEPRMEWAKKLIEQVDQLAGKVDNLTTEVQKMDIAMAELKQLSTDGRSLSQTAVRLDTQLSAAVKSLDQLTQEMNSLKDFKTTGQTLIGWLRWFFTGGLAATLVVGGMVCSSVRESAEVRTTVIAQGARVEKLEQATAKFQEAASGSATANRVLAENIEKNTNATKQLVADVQKEIKSLQSSKVELARTHEMTARFLLADKATRRLNKESIEFEWKLIRPVEKSKAEQTKVTARLVPMSGRSEPDSGLLSENTQLRAGLTSDGQSCWLEIFSSQIGRIASILKRYPATSVEITIVIPD